MSSHVETYTLVALTYILKDLKSFPQVLLAVRLSDGHLTAPGGKILPKENSKLAAAREIQEETGLVVPDTHLKPINSLPIMCQIHKKIFTFYCFQTYYQEQFGLPQTTEPDKLSPWVWIPLHVLDLEFAHHDLFPYDLLFMAYPTLP